MFEFKSSKINVKSLESFEKYSIDMKHIETEKYQRSIGFEYVHVYMGELKDNSDNVMKLVVTIFEFPKGIFNYIEIENDSCLVIDEISENSFNYVINKG
jgi:hypothetical protein